MWNSSHAGDRWPRWRIGGLHLLAHRKRLEGLGKKSRQPSEQDDDLIKREGPRKHRAIAALRNAVAIGGQGNAAAKRAWQPARALCVRVSARIKEGKNVNTALVNPFFPSGKKCFLTLLCVSISLLSIPNYKKPYLTHVITLAMIVTQLGARKFILDTQTPATADRSDR